jgi:uncharacterized protein (TIGR03067 family)
MRSTALLGLALALSVTGVLAADTDDDRAIEGTWVVDPATFDGAPDKDEVEKLLKELRQMRITFRDHEMTIKHPPEPPPFERGREEKSAFRLDPSTSPKRFDLSDSARGIYELKGDTLKLCWDLRGKENGRPTRFGFDKATVVYYVLKRMKK